VRDSVLDAYAGKSFPSMSLLPGCRTKKLDPASLNPGFFSFSRTPPCAQLSDVTVPIVRLSGRTGACCRSIALAVVIAEESASGITGRAAIKRLFSRPIKRWVKDYARSSQGGSLIPKYRSAVGRSLSEVGVLVRA